LARAATRTKPPEPEFAFDFTVSANEYGFYCVPRAYQGRGIPNLLAKGGVYEPKTLRFLRRQLGTGDIVTGGAFVGDFFPALCDALAPKAQLHSFEPVDLSYHACNETIRLNRLRNVRLHNVAVGDRDDTVTMQVARPGGRKIAAGEKIVADAPADDARFVSVPLVTIDSLVPKTRKVSVLHLDVEGFERQALKGAARILTDHTPLVVLESGKAWRNRTYLDDLAALAPKAGYHLAGEIEKNAIFIPA
jgi:FkbM family methyltransferase